MEPLPTWDHVKDQDLVAWLRSLPADRQIFLKDRNDWMLDRARGDAMMAETIALAPLEEPFPLGFDDWTEAEKTVWWNEVWAPRSQSIHAERRAIEAAVARGEYVA